MHMPWQEASHTSGPDILTESFTLIQCIQLYFDRTACELSSAGDAVSTPIFKATASQELWGINDSIIHIRLPYPIIVYPLILSVHEPTIGRDSTVVFSTFL
jgi:hypothetical protein